MLQKTKYDNDEYNHDSQFDNVDDCNADDWVHPIRNRLDEPKAGVRQLQIKWTHERQILADEYHPKPKSNNEFTAQRRRANDKEGWQTDSVTTEAAVSTQNLC